MDWFYKILVKIKFLKLLQDPTQTKAVFDILDLAGKIKENDEMLKGFEKGLLESPVLRSMWEERWIPPNITMAQLQKLPERTLGKAYYHHLIDNNLEILFAPEMRIQRPIDYVTYRVLKQHDIVHTILGLDTEVENEVALQGFNLGQLKSPVSLTLVAGGLIHLVDKEPKRALEYYEKAHEFYEQGVQAKFFLEYKLEEMLDWPLEDVRKELNIVA